MSTGPDDPASDPAGSPEAGAPAVTTLPGARFDPVTGAELGGRDGARRGSYALQQGEPVMSFNLVSSLLPLASGTSPQTYRWALALGLLVPIVAGALGYLAFAFVAAALVIPVVYTIYLYDVNQWDDQPVGVTLGTLGVAGALGVGFTWVWHGLLHDGSVTSTAGVGFDGHRLDRAAGAVPARADRLGGPQAGRAGLPRLPPSVRRPHRCAHLRGGRGLGLRRGRDDRGQPCAVQQLRPGRRRQQRLLGLPRAVRGPGEAHRLRGSHWHRVGGVLRRRPRLLRIQGPLRPRARGSHRRQHHLPGGDVHRQPGRRHERCGAGPGARRGCGRRTPAAVAVLAAHRRARGRTRERVGGRRAQGHRSRDRLVSLVRPASGRGRQLLRRLRYGGPGGQQGQPSSQRGPRRGGHDSSSNGAPARPPANGTRGRRRAGSRARRAD